MPNVIDWSTEQRQEVPSEPPVGAVDWSTGERKVTEPARGTFAKLADLVFGNTLPNAVQSGVDWAAKKVGGTNGTLGKLTPADVSELRPPGESVSHLFDESRGTFSKRLKAAALEVPMEVATLTPGGELLRRVAATGEKGTKIANAALGAGTELGDQIQQIAVDPRTAIPIGALGKIGTAASTARKIGSGVLRTVSAGLSVASGVGSVQALDAAYGEWQQNGITPELGRLLADAATSGGMAALAGFGAASGGHSGGSRVGGMMEEIRASAASERLRAIQEGRAPDPATLQALDVLRDEWVNAQRAEKLAIRSQKLKVSDEAAPLDLSNEPVSRDTATQTKTVRSWVEGDQGPVPVDIEVPVEAQAPVPAPKFQKPTLASPDRMPVLVDLEKFDQAWAKGDPSAYITTTDEVALKRMLETIDSGKPVEMAEAKLGDNGSIVIDDGHANLAALRDLGVKRAEVMVPFDDLATVQRHFSPELDPIPLSETGPFVKPGTSTDLVLDLPPAEYVKRLPAKPELDTPFRAIQHATPSEIGKKPGVAYVATHQMLDAVGKIHPAAQQIMEGLLNDKEIGQSRIAARTLEAHRQLTKAEAGTIIRDLESTPRDQLTGGRATLRRMFDDGWDYANAVPEVKAQLERLGITKLENYAPHILETPLTKAEKIQLYADKLMKDSTANGNPLTEAQALSMASAQKAAAALRYADKQIQLSGALTNHRLGTDRPIRQDIGAVYAYGQKLVAHVTEMKWLGENRSKLTNPEGTGVIDRISRPLTAEESVGLTGDQIAKTNAQRAAAGQYVSDAFDMLLGRDYKTFREKAYSSAQQAYSLLAMVFSAPIQGSTSANTALWGGTARTMQSGLELLFSRAKRESALLEAMRSGATHPNFSGEFGSIYGGGKFMWGVGAADKWMRVLANDVGRKMLDDARQGDENALARLETQGFFRVAKQQGLARLDSLQPTEVNYDLAAKTFSDFTQFRTDAARTATWTNTPETRALMQFVRFPQKEGVFIWKAARHAVANKDPGVFIRLIPTLIAMGAGINTMKRLLNDTAPGLLAVTAAKAGIGHETRTYEDVGNELLHNYVDDAEQMANTFVSWRKNPEAFFGKIMSSRGVAVDKRHPETAVAAVIQALVQAGVMAAYETVFDRATGKPEEMGGATIGAAYKLIDALQSAGRAGTSRLMGNKEDAGKKIEHAAKVGLSALGPLGQQASREFLSKDASGQRVLPEHAAFVGSIHNALVAGTSDARRAQEELNRALRQVDYEKILLDEAAPEKAKKPPEPIEVRTANARLAALKTRMYSELVRLYKLGQVGAALDRAREFNRELATKFKVKKPANYKFVQELIATSAITPEAIAAVEKQLEVGDAGD
jgi:hypothetical protein